MARITYFLIIVTDHDLYFSDYVIYLVTVSKYYRVLIQFAHLK